MTVSKKALLVLFFCQILLFQLSAQENKNYQIGVRINFWKGDSGKLLSITDSNLVLLKNGKPLSIPLSDIKVIKIYAYQRQALLNTVTLLAAISNIVYSITIDDPLTAVLVGVVGTPVLLVTGFFIHKALNPSVFAIHAKKVPLTYPILREKLSPYIATLSQ